jgi:hypothetical protein
MNKSFWLSAGKTAFGFVVFLAMFSQPKHGVVKPATFQGPYVLYNVVNYIVGICFMISGVRELTRRAKPPAD